MSRALRIGSVVSALLVAALAPATALEVPYLAARVIDLADLIPASTETQIEARLARLEAETGSQVAVLTIPSLEGEALEVYTQRVAETWGLGRAEVDDGVLFLVARDDRKMRIEVGYGLEGNLTDLQTSRILTEIVRPHFQAGDFGAGIEGGVTAIVTTIEGGEALPPPREREPGGGESVWHVVFFFSLFTLFGSGRLGWLISPLIALAWFVVVSATFGTLYGVLAILAWAVIFAAIRLIGRGLGKLGGDAGWSSRSGSWGGGGFSSGSSSGGGFSGGGGSFGGGGSSSGW